MSTPRRDVFSDPRTPRLSRRSTLKAGGVSLAAALSLAARPVAAQEGELPEVVAQYAAAWEALDPDQIAGLYAEDAVHEDVPLGMEVQGPAAIRESVAGFINAFSDASMESTTAFASENQAADVWAFTGNYTGTLEGLPPGSGQPVTMRGVSLLEFADGEIQRSADYYDAYGLLIQIGVVPPPEMEATPAG